MLFDIKNNEDDTIVCECHKCTNVTTKTLMLFGDIGIHICDKCLNNTVSKLSDEFSFRTIE